MYRLLFIVVAILAVALGLLIGTLNADLVRIDLLWVQLEWPLGLVILSAAALGLFFGLVLVWFFSVLPLRSRLRKIRGRDPYAPPDKLKNGND